MIEIISGGQTGVDLAALDTASVFGIHCGGWCPKGRINEEGTIHKKYELKEIHGDYNTDKENYDARTKANIKDSDGTLIFVPSYPLPPAIQDGTLLTISEAKKQKKPFLIIDLSRPASEGIVSISDWIETHAIVTLNIAGPRESTCPGIYKQTTSFLLEMFQNLKCSCQPRARL